MKLIISSQVVTQQIPSRDTGVDTCSSTRESQSTEIKNPCEVTWGEPRYLNRIVTATFTCKLKEIKTIIKNFFILHEMPDSGRYVISSGENVPLWNLLSCIFFLSCFVMKCATCWEFCMIISIQRNTFLSKKQTQISKMLWPLLSKSCEHQIDKQIHFQPTLIAWWCQLTLLLLPETKVAFPRL